MIPFNKPLAVGNEMNYIQEAIKNNKICGDGIFTSKCSEWIENITKSNKVLLTTSCTHALEMAAILLDIKEGDEVIMPSFTFVSTANAFVMRGAKIVFVDIRPDTMNIDENLIEQAITQRTKAIVPVHYAGVACDMDKITTIANKYNLAIIEDAAQGVMARYKEKNLGSMGEFGCYSFHETKNYTSGEGGALLINNSKYIEKAEIIREKGTNRSKFWRGEIDKYTWVSKGSSYLPSELNAAYLYAQLEQAEKINKRRIDIWNMYYNMLSSLKDVEKIELPVIPKECSQNGHIFYIKTKDLYERTRLINFLKLKGIMAVFHYIPLHSSTAGKIFGRFSGDDIYTTMESERILRLPIYYGLKDDEIKYIVKMIYEFYGKEKQEV